jgi:hypothetical protein
VPRKKCMDFRRRQARKSEVRFVSWRHHPQMPNPDSAWVDGNERILARTKEPSPQAPRYEQRACWIRRSSRLQPHGGGALALPKGGFVPWNSHKTQYTTRFPPSSVASSLASLLMSRGVNSVPMTAPAIAP